MTSVRIVKDSITDNGDRLISFISRHPRPNHADYMTHRDFSRNASSSRAIPLKRMRELAIADPYIPQHWGANQKGMQAFQEVSDDLKKEALAWWQRGFDFAMAHHEEGELLGLHKQLVNRYIEPYVFIEVLTTTTNPANFLWLRDHPMADYPMQQVAKGLRHEYMNSMPTYIPPGGWHLPFIDKTEEGWPIEEQIRVSTGRCARISYLTHEGKRDPADDLRLHDDLVSRPEGSGNVWDMDPVHASPAEHPCQAMGDGQKYANLVGWRSYRKTLPYEGGPPMGNKCLKCGLWEGTHVTTCPNKV